MEVSKPKTVHCKPELPIIDTNVGIKQETSDMLDEEISDLKNKSIMEE